MNKKIVLWIFVVSLMVASSPVVISQESSGFPDFSDPDVWTRVDLQSNGDSLASIDTNGVVTALMYLNGTNQLVFAIQDGPGSQVFTKKTITNGSTYLNGGYELKYVGDQTWIVFYVDSTLTDMIFGKTTDDGDSWDFTTVTTTNGIEPLVEPFVASVNTYSVQTGSVFYTSDGGDSWNSAFCPGVSQGVTYYLGETNFVMVGRGVGAPFTDLVNHQLSTDTCATLLDGSPSTEDDYAWRVSEDDLAVSAGQTGELLVPGYAAILKCAAAEKNIWVVEYGVLDSLNDNVEPATTQIPLTACTTNQIGVSNDGDSSAFLFGIGGGFVGLVVSSSNLAQSSSYYSLQSSIPALPDEGLMALASGHVHIFQRNAANNTNYIWISEAIEVSTLLEPEEFGTGLAAFIAGLGFITRESQFFFSIILVGVTTVLVGVLLKIMGPGRAKVFIVFGAGALVATFCVVLLLFDLWMHVVAIVLGATVVRGARDFRNTFAEIQSLIKNRRKGSGEGEDDEAEEVMGSAPGKVTVEEVEVDDDEGVIEAPEDMVIEDTPAPIEGTGSKSYGSDVSEV